jgi:tetratricopeptide (TPR) repeat protein
MDKPKYLKLEQQNPNDWAFNRPPEWEFFDRRLDKAEAFEREGNNEKAIEICFEIIKSCPEYLPAINKLGLMYLDQGDLDNAIFMFDSTVAIGLACLPDEFKPGTDLIPSYWVDNRAFLYAHDNLGLCCLKKALLAYESVSELNPNHDYEAISKLRELLGIEEEDDTE